MNIILQNKLKKLENSGDYECWYLVKQPTSFSSLCYLVSFLEEFELKDISSNLQEFISAKVNKLKLSKPDVQISNNYRALRVAAFFGLITMTSSKYDEAVITETFREITEKCDGNYENTELYIDLIQRQIEKMFISSEIDEAHNGVRKGYRLYPVMLLYKVLIEIGRSTGKYQISMTEYRYLVATTEKFEDFLETLLLIKLLREDKSAANDFEQYRTKFDNRLIQALKQLTTLVIDRDSISIKEGCIAEVAKKVFVFEENANVFMKENYITFLGSSKSLFQLDGYEIQENLRESNNGKINFNTNILPYIERNKIIFGAPGTGKSFTINQEKEELLINGGEYERVTFHPDYSYANFVGTYKPTMIECKEDSVIDMNKKEVISILTDKSKNAQEKYDLLYDRFKEEGLTHLPLLLGIYTDEEFKTLKMDGSNASGDNSVERNHGRAIRPYVQLMSNKKTSSEIAYEYVPGPFMRTLVKALKNAKTDNPKPYLLIIEEINRANVAAVFGDVFQLLDRGDDNVSEYPICVSEDMKKYLAKPENLGGKPEDYAEIKIPDNMFIWATMNSADQGVFPMDTAFKRRWDFSYLGINKNEDKIKGKFVTLGTGKYECRVEWNELRKAINKELCSYKINEDKLLGPYFLSKKIIPTEGDINQEKFIDAFMSKVIMYLFDDAAKQKRKSLFEGCEGASENTLMYSAVCNEFQEKGVFIFSKNIWDKFFDKQTMPKEADIK